MAGVDPSGELWALTRSTAPVCSATWCVQSMSASVSGPAPAPACFPAPPSSPPCRAPSATRAPPLCDACTLSWCSFLAPALRGAGCRVTSLAEGGSQGGSGGIITRVDGSVWWCDAKAGRAGAPGGFHDGRTYRDGWRGCAR